MNTTMGLRNRYEKTERYIISNIQDKFLKTQAFHERAKLFEESDVWVTEEQKRILDMAFLLAKRYLIQPISATQFQPYAWFGFLLLLKAIQLILKPTVLVQPLPFRTYK